MERAISETTPVPVADSAAAELGLLRAFEPIIRYTKGELFLPMAVEPYVGRCSLWMREPQRDPVCVVRPGELTLEGLRAESLAHREASLSLRYVAEPLGWSERQRWRRTRRERLRSAGRLTTTGIFGRLVEAGFRASLLVRGKVSTGLAAAAEIAYREDCADDPPVYYGRVVREGGYICLQYWVFYAMNDWRSTFGGLNDHEADWELVTVYLVEGEGAGEGEGEGAAPRPAWVGVSSHEEDGDSLRRRWDDPELRLQGDHPMVFAGAGSHSGAFVPGDYVVSVDPPQLRIPIALAKRVQRLLAPWRDETRAATGVGIPFVDYMRGDGLSVGPGEEKEWAPRLIDDDTPWVRAYRGLWGLDTEDPFGGERAPAGPRYQRDGSVRPAWATPLGWSGLLKVPPAEEDAAGLLAQRVRSLEVELDEMDVGIAAEREALRGLQVQVRSLAARDSTRALAESRRAELTRREEELGAQIAERTRLGDELRTHLGSLEGLPVESPQAHLSSHRGPRTVGEQRRARLLRAWSVISTPLLLASPIVFLIGSPLAFLTTILALFILFLGVEALARERFISFLGSSLLLIGAIAAGVGLVLLLLLVLQNHWRTVLSVILGAAALALLIGNLGDLRHGFLRGARPQEEREDLQSTG